MGWAGPAGPAQYNPWPVHQRRLMTSPEYSYVRMLYFVNDMKQKKRRDKVLFTAVVIMATNMQAKGQLLRGYRNESGGVTLVLCTNL